MSDVLRRLNNLEMFKSLPERELIELASSMSIVQYKNRDFLFRKNEPIKYIYLLLCGSVKIQDAINATETKIFNFLARGEFLGVAMAGLPQPKYPTAAQCNEDCTMIKIPLSLFFKTVILIPEVRREVNKQISERFLEFQNDSCKSHTLVPFRVADFLIRLLQRQGNEGNGRIQIPLTRFDIAERVGAQSETVIRIMSQWTKSGWISTEDRYVHVLDRNALLGIQSDRPPKRATATT